MSIYVRQVPPDQQESPLIAVKDIISSKYPDIILDGNRDCVPYTNDLYKTIQDIMADKDIYIKDLKSANPYGYQVAKKILKDFSIVKANNKAFTMEEIKEFRDCLIKREMSIETIISKILSIVSCRKYNHVCIKGSCQRDWQTMFYPEKTESDKNGYDRAFIKMFECEYFNEGKEWIVHDEDNPVNCANDICGYSLYTHGYDTKTNKKEIAENLGCKPGEIVMYEFEGYITIANYCLKDISQ